MDLTYSALKQCRDGCIFGMFLHGSMFPTQAYDSIYVQSYSFLFTCGGCVLIDKENVEERYEEISCLTLRIERYGKKLSLFSLPFKCSIRFKGT